MIAKLRTRFGMVVCMAAMLRGSGLEARTWTEAATGRKIEAEMVSSDGSNVVVATRDGRRLTIPLARLTEDDKAFVQKSRGGAAAPAKAPAVKKVEDLFEDVPKLSEEKIPMSGEEHKALAAVDAAIRKYMAEKGAPAVTFSLSKKGKVLHDRAFGWADSDLKTPLQPGVKMRVASMTKPVVSAAIKTLIADNKLKTEDCVYAVLKLDEYPEAKGCDARFKKVTIEQLLGHKGGWDTGKSGDLSGRSAEITKLFKIELNEMEPMHIVRYGMTLPMDFDPGEREAYCNFGYILLARVVEKVSGQKFIEFVQSTVAKKSEAPSFSLSRSDARDRQPGEIWYCYHPDFDEKMVPLDSRTEARDGAGALACTSADYCRFLETYWISGAVREGGSASYSFNGSHPGVTAVCAQRRDGINYAAIVNRRGSGPAGSWNDELRDAINKALEPVVDKL
jgi:CubicO group peptidase (beta-lactamase class C family)